MRKDSNLYPTECCQVFYRTAKCDVCGSEQTWGPWMALRDGWVLIVAQDGDRTHRVVGVCPDCNDEDTLATAREQLRAALDQPGAIRYWGAPHEDEEGEPCH